MAKRKKNQKKMEIDGLTITENQLHYMHDGFSCGYGKFKNKKAYNRRKKHRYKEDN